MRRDAFHRLFKTPGCVVLPVVHALDAAQVAENLRVIAGEGAPGAFLINHDFDAERFMPVLREIRAQWPNLWLGVNLLGVTGATAFPRLGELATEELAFDGYWADDARIDERTQPQPEADAIAAARAAANWPPLYFGGVAFKKQREVLPADYARAAQLARGYMDVVTTSGVATGHAADVDKVETFRVACGDTPLALASGVSADNFTAYAEHVDCALVATGIGRDFHHLSALKLAQLLRVARSTGPRASRGPRDDRWYLSLMAPNNRGERFAWLDPTSIYINRHAFEDLLDDLCAELVADDIDVVAGLDAMGFVLAAALGARLGRGMLPIRKADRLCVDTDRVPYSNYSGRTQDMEMRMPAFAPGTRVLLVDQWVETGGTMDGAVRLVERQRGEVAGIVAIAIEETPGSAALRERFRCISAVVPGSRWQAECNAQILASFATYDPVRAFPTAPRGR